MTSFASLVPVTPLRGRMIEDMKLAGLSIKTQACYVDAAKNLSLFFGASPSVLTQEQVRKFFVHCVFRRNPAIDSDRIRPPVPIESGH